MQHSAQLGRAKSALVGLLAAVLAATLMAPSLAFADPASASKQAEAQAALASLNALQEKLDRASADEFTAQEDQQAAEQACDEAEARIAEATDQITDLQERLSIRARSMYRTGNSTMLDLLFGATTFQAFATNWDLLNSLNESDADLVRQTKELRAEVEEQKAVLDEQQRIAAEKAAEAKRIREEAEATVASMQATYSSLSAEAAALLEQERAAQVAAQAAVAKDVVANSIKQAGANNNANANTGNTSDNGNGGATGGNEGYPSGGEDVYTPAPGPSYNAVTGNAIVDRALGCLGLDYDYGSCGPSSFDCSGLVSYAVTGSFSRLGSTYTFMGYPQVSDPQPGDICVNEGHCGIYYGNNQMIHAATYGVGVVIGPVQGGMIIVRP